jgi:hypothetical protein
MPEEYPTQDMKSRLRTASGKRPSVHKAQRAPVTSIAKVLSNRTRKNSRRKGNRNELDIAKVFSNWSGELVRRTPGSGGWSTEKFGVTADLVCPKKAFPFHVEVKNRQGWFLDDLVTGARDDHDKSIVQWWIQCTTSCPAKKIPLLVFRRSRQPWLVMIATTSLPGIYMLPNVIATTMGGEVGDTVRDVSVVLLSTFLGAASVPKGLRNYNK